MIYLVDGYNLLFRLFHSEKKFESQREVLIEFLEEKATLLNLDINLIFDGYKQNQELANTSYFEKLKVIYTSKGQTADDYIIEQIFLSKNPSQIVVVTSDKSLKKKSEELHASTRSIDSFINWITKKETEKRNNNNFEKEEKEFIDTKQNIQRLLKIFEDKLKNEPDDRN